MARVAIVGAGLVGSTIAFSLLHRRLARELWLVDSDARRAEGEAMDLSQGLAFLKYASVAARSLEDCAGADLVVVAAGRNSRPGETRMDLLRDNGGRAVAISRAVASWKPRPVLIVVSNPVDVLTELSARELGRDGRTFGSGTSLDTARLRLMLGEAYGFAPESVHGYVLGEHGDTEFPAWSTVAAGGLPLRDWPGGDPALNDSLFERTRRAAYEVVARKRATHFAVAAAVGAIAEAVLRDQKAVLPVSVPLSGQYGLSGLSLSLPCVVGARGVERVLEPRLDEGERAALSRSAQAIAAALRSVAPA
jgi:L-lactate dehydrogenase